MGNTDARAASNDVIISLAQANVGEEVILALVASEACGYDLSVERIGSLKKSGVSGRVIAAMLRKCGATKSGDGAASDPSSSRVWRPGVYIRGQEGQLDEWLSIIPAIVTPGLAGGNGSLLFPNTSKLTLPGARSRFRLFERRPFFRIIVGGGTEFQEAASGTSEIPGYEGLRLVRFDIKGEKRVLKVGSSLNGAILSGVDQDRNMPIAISLKSRVVYEVVVATSLIPGQYALMSGEGGKSYKLFDFSVE